MFAIFEKNIINYRELHCQSQFTKLLISEMRYYLKYYHVKFQPNQLIYDIRNIYLQKNVSCIDLHNYIILFLTCKGRSGSTFPLLIVPVA